MSEGLKRIDQLAGMTAAFLVSVGLLQIYLGERVSQSVALTANGIDCIGDGFVSSIVWIGLKYFRRPADDRFHYGYYKLENLASIVAAIVMLLLASYIFYRSYNQFIDPHDVEAPLLGSVVAFIAGAVTLVFGYLKYQEGKKLNLSSLKLEVFNTFKDAGASFLAVIALMVAAAGYPVADAVVGFIIAFIILGIGFAAIKEASLMLVDACDEDCNSNRTIMVNLANSIEGIETSRVVRLRRSGPVLLGELVVEVDPQMTVKEMATITATLKEELDATIDNIENVAISVMPASEGSSEKD